MLKVHSHQARNFILTAHLGLQVPAEDKGECWMRVGGRRKRWAMGELNVIDTSYEHETMNATEEPRYVLIIDFWHPGLEDGERDALQTVYDVRNRFDRQFYDENLDQPEPEPEPIWGQALRGLTGRRTAK